MQSLFFICSIFVISSKNTAENNMVLRYLPALLIIPGISTLRLPIHPFHILLVVWWIGLSSPYYCAQAPVSLPTQACYNPAIYKGNYIADVCFLHIKMPPFHWRLTSKNREHLWHYTKKFMVFLPIVPTPKTCCVAIRNWPPGCLSAAAAICQR